MARRGHIGGGWQGFQIDPIDFLHGGDGRDKSDNEIAMALMGYGKGGPQAQALDERQQAAMELYQQGQLANMASQQRIAEENLKAAGEAREYGKTKDIQERMDKGDVEATRKQENAEALARAREVEGRATAKGLLDTMVKEGRIKVGDADYNRLAERSMPGYGEESKQLEQAARERTIAEGVTRYQKASPKEREAYAKTPASLATPDVYDEILKRAGVNVASPGAPATAKTFEGAISKPWQEYQAPPDLSELLTPAPAPSGTEGIAPWLRPEAPAKGAMDWRYGGGGPSVDPGRYEKFPGSVEDLIAASGQQQPIAEPPSVPVPAAPVAAPEGTGFLDELLRKIRGGGPPMPSQGVFQPFPG